MNWLQQHSAFVYFITFCIVFCAGYLVACSVWHPQVRALIAEKVLLEKELFAEFAVADELRGLIYDLPRKAGQVPSATALPSRLRDVVEAENV